MAADGVVKALDMIKNVRPGRVARRVDLFGDALGFLRRKERLHGYMVADISCPPHRTINVVISHQAQEIFARGLATLVGVMQKGVRPSAAQDRYDQRVR